MPLQNINFNDATIQANVVSFNTLSSSNVYFDGLDYYLNTNINGVQYVSKLILKESLPFYNFVYASNTTQQIQNTNILNYLVVDTAVDTFSATFNSFTIGLSNIFVSSNFNSCRLRVNLGPGLSCNKTDIFVTTDAVLSSNTNQFFTFSYFTTGSLLLGFALSGITPQTTPRVPSFPTPTPSITPTITPTPTTSSGITLNTESIILNFPSPVTQYSGTIAAGNYPLQRLNNSNWITSGSVPLPPPNFYNALSIAFNSNWPGSYGYFPEGNNRWVVYRGYNDDGNKYFESLYYHPTHPNTSIPASGWLLASFNGNQTIGGVLTITAGISATPTMTPTITVTPTITPTTSAVSVTPTTTVTPTPSFTPTRTVTPTPTR